MPFGEAVRGYIAINPCHASNHGKTANVNELVNSQAAADHGPVFDHDMTSHLNSIRHHNPIAQLTVVTKVAIGHQQVVITDLGLFTFLRGPVDGDVFPNCVGIANYHLCGCAAILEVLWLKTKAGAGENPVIGAKGQTAIEHHMGTNPGIRTNLHVRSNHCSRPNNDTGSELSTRIHHSRRMNLSLFFGSDR
jgi:hypothetical protein